MMPFRQMRYCANVKPRQRSDRARSLAGSRLVGLASSTIWRRRRAEILSPFCATNASIGPLRAHPALVQHHHIVARRRLVDEMRRPEHADPLLREQAPHMVENARRAP